MSHWTHRASGDKALTGANISFDTRSRCPSCDATGSDSIWSGRYSDPGIAEMVDLFGYSVDAPALLGDRPFDLVQCDACGLRYHRYVIDVPSVQTVYGTWTDSDQVARFEARHGVADPVEAAVGRIKLGLRLRRLLHRFDAPLRWLDFGCGDGRSLEAGRALAFDMIGIDVSASRAAQAAQRHKQVYPSLESFDRLDGNKVHAVTLEQVLEHLVEPRDVLDALRQHMHPGGVLFVSVPNCAGVDRPKDFESFHKLQPVEHVNAFTPKTLRDLCRRAGFRPLRRPAAFVTTRPAGALRSLGGLVWQPPSTEQFFRLG